MFGVMLDIARFSIDDGFIARIWRNPQRGYHAWLYYMSTALGRIAACVISLLKGMKTSHAKGPFIYELSCEIFAVERSVTKLGKFAADFLVHVLARQSSGDAHNRSR